MKALLDLDTVNGFATVETNFLNAVENTVFLGLRKEKPLSLPNFQLLISVIEILIP